MQCSAEENSLNSNINSLLKDQALQASRNRDSADYTHKSQDYVTPETGKGPSQDLKNIIEDGVDYSYPLSCDKETHISKVNKHCSFNKLTDFHVAAQSEECIGNEKLSKTAQLQIKLERLSYANQSHKKAISNLPNIIIKLKKLDIRVIRKVERYGLIKISSDLLKPSLPQDRKKHWGKSPNKVVFEKEFDKRVFLNAVRRGAKIVDKGGFLKYQCPKCCFKTYTFFGLAKHHVGLHGVKINFTFTCPDCNFTTTHECTMKRHQQRHKKEPDLPCPHCPYITRFDIALRTHLRRWHLPDEEAKTLRCTYCNYVSICKTTYDAHLRVHMNRGEKFLSRFVHNSAKSTEAEVLKCEYCKFRSPDNIGLRRHMQETHKIKSYIKEVFRCKICGLEIKHRFSFQDHMLIHKKVEDKSLLQCNDCGFKTKWRKYLVVHMRTDHPRNKQRKETVYYHCAECDKKFPRKYSLKAHIFKQHKDSETLMCHDCNYTTKSMAVLRNHTLCQHINVKKKIYKCQKCFRISKDKKKHKAHLRTHKLVCYMCGYETPTKTALRYHIISHMSKKMQQKVAKIYKCQCCDYKTRNKHHYERHMKRWGHQPEELLENMLEVEHSEKNKPILDNVHPIEQSLESKIEVDPFDTLLETKINVLPTKDKEICSKMLYHSDQPSKNEVTDEDKQLELL